MVRTETDAESSYDTLLKELRWMGYETIEAVPLKGLEGRKHHIIDRREMKHVGSVYVETANMAPGKPRENQRIYLSRTEKKSFPDNVVHVLDNYCKIE